MKDLLVWVTSWGRPRHLKATLDSIASQADVSHDIAVVDNASGPETAAVIKGHPAVKWYFLLSENKGINWPIQHLLPTILDHRYVMIADQDLHFSKPFSLYLDLLETQWDRVLVAKGLDAPEHTPCGELVHRGETWLLKQSERGGGVVFDAPMLRHMFPLPPSNIDFDVHLCNWLKSVGSLFAVLPGACVHTGWQRGDSTWQDIEIPERYILQDGRIIKREV